MSEPTRSPDAACDHGLEEPGQRPESPEQGEGASGMATGSVIPQPGSGSSNPSAANDQRTGDRAVALARRFHEAYEEFAPVFDYETRPETRVTWEELPDNNRKLMIAVCVAVLHDIEAATWRRA